MSSFKPHRSNVRAHGSTKHAPRRARALIAAGVGLATAIAISLGVVVTDGAGTSTAMPTHDNGDRSLPRGYRLSGEIGPMGGQVLETPGTRSGTASAGGVVVDGADLVMGHIPLAYAVNPTWQLRNSSEQTVTLGRPKVAVVKGCCPADPILGATTLAPGEETTLQFPTQMHPGMDGDHLFRLTVPVGESGAPLSVSVSGDFS